MRVRLIAWALAWALAGLFIALVMFAPATPRGALVVTSWTSNFQPMDPLYHLLSLLSAGVVIAIAALLDAK